MAATKMDKIQCFGRWFPYFVWCIVALSSCALVNFAISISIKFAKSYMFEIFFLWIAIFYFLTFGFVAICLKKKANQLEEKQKGKPSERYLGMRLKAARYMTIPNDSGQSWMEEMVLITKKCIANRLEGCQRNEERNVQKAKAMMETLHKDLFSSEEAENQLKMKRAVILTIKSTTIKNPVDILGRRRSHYMISLLSELTDSSFLESLEPIKSCLSSCTNFCLQTCRMIMFPLLSCCCFRFILHIWSLILNTISIFCSLIYSFCSCCSSSGSKKYSMESLLSTTAVVLFTAILIVWDIYTDVNLVVVYWNLWQSTDFLFIIITGHPANEVPGSEILIPVIYLSIILGVSMIIAIVTNPLKKMARLFKVEVKMKSGEVEDSGECLTNSSVIQRHDFSIDESSMESPLQSIWQFAIYFSSVLLVHSIPANLDSNVAIINDLVAYDEHLKFLWDLFLSSLSSVISLTNGQLKRNYVFNEFNLSWKQKAFYILASLLSTMAFLVPSIMALTLFLDIFYNMPTWLIVTIILMGTTISMLIHHMATWFTGSNQHAKLALRSSWIQSLFTALFLPTSQNITGGRYNIYHTIITQSPHLLRRVQEQCLAYTITIALIILYSSLHLYGWSNNMTLSSNYVKNMSDYSAYLNYTQNLTDDNFLNNILNIVNDTIVDTSRSFITNGTAFLLPPSTISPARRNLMVAFLFFPVVLALSYACLWIYFIMDDGFFSSVSMDFWFHDDKSTGEGEDNEAIEESEENTVQLIIDPGQDSITDNGARSCNIEGQTEEEKLDQDKLNCCGGTTLTDWIQKWIDQSEEYDWYSWTKNKELDMDGTWVDLTGHDGLEGPCSDGAAVENSEEGSLEHAIKMSFPFFHKKEEEKVVETQI